MNTKDYIKVDGYEKQDVVKANLLVQKSRYMMPVVQQRTMAYIISMMEGQVIPKNGEYATPKLEYIFNIADYIRACEIQKAGRAYDDVKKTLKDISDQSMYLKLPNGIETLVRWLSKVWIDEKGGRIKVRLDEDLAPYLFNLRDNYFTYKFDYVKKMRSHFSFRLYEILKSYAYMDKKVIFNLDVLKQRLAVENSKSYNNFNLFRTRVLDTAIPEINSMTDIQVSYRPIKHGRKVVEIEFTIEPQSREIEGKSLTEGEQIPLDDIPLIEGEFNEIEAEGLYPQEVYAAIPEFDRERINLLMELLKTKRPGTIQDQLAYLKIKYQEMNLQKPQNRFSYLKKMIENESYPETPNQERIAKNEKKGRKETPFNTYLEREDVDFEGIEKRAQLQMTYPDTWEQEYEKWLSERES